MREKGILEEIREQPEHIRHIFMWVLVVITFSVVGFVWFRNTEKKLVALINPEQAAQTQALAEKTNANNPSPFATIYESLRGLKANVSELFFGGGSKVNINNTVGGNSEEVLPQKLPLSGNK